MRSLRRIHACIVLFLFLLCFFPAFLWGENSSETVSFGGTIDPDHSTHMGSGSQEIEKQENNLPYEQSTEKQQVAEQDSIGTAPCNHSTSTGDEEAFSKKASNDSAGAEGEQVDNREQTSESHVQKEIPADRSARPNGSTGKRVEDRSWIIKKRPMQSLKSKPCEPISVEWETDAQKSRCTSYLEQLKKSFLDARYGSVQGDSCNTARHADKFLSLVDACQGECPERFMEASGFSGRIIDNLRVLRQLGTRRCLGSK